jgi:hypothetical protein
MVAGVWWDCVEGSGFVLAACVGVACEGAWIGLILRIRLESVGVLEGVSG